MAAVAGCDQAQPAQANGPRPIGDGSLHMTMRFCSATSSVTKAFPPKRLPYSSLASLPVKTYNLRTPQARSRASHAFGENGYDSAHPLMRPS